MNEPTENEKEIESQSESHGRALTRLPTEVKTCIIATAREFSGTLDLKTKVMEVLQARFGYQPPRQAVDYWIKKALESGVRITVSPESAALVAELIERGYAKTPVAMVEIALRHYVNTIARAKELPPHP